MHLLCINFHHYIRGNLDSRMGGTELCADKLSMVQLLQTNLFNFQGSVEKNVQRNLCYIESRDIGSYNQMHLITIVV